MHALAIDLHRLGVELNAQITGLDDRLGVPLGAADDGVDARDELVLMERLRHVVVGAEAEATHLVLDAGKPERMRIGVATLLTRSVLRTSYPLISGRFRSSRIMS